MYSLTGCLFWYLVLIEYGPYALRNTRLVFSFSLPSTTDGYIKNFYIVHSLLLILTYIRPRMIQSIHYYYYVIISDIFTLRAYRYPIVPPIFYKQNSLYLSRSLSLSHTHTHTHRVFLVYHYVSLDSYI